MATAHDPSLDELNRQSALLEAEARMLRAQADKARAEQALADAKRSPFDLDPSGWLLLVKAAAFALALMSIGFGVVAFGHSHG